MRTFFASALATFAAAGKVHEFKAEAYFICQMCMSVLENVKNGNGAEIDRLYNSVPALEERMTAFLGRDDLVDLNDIEGTCKAINMCETEDVLDMLMAEQPLNLDKHVEAVNSNPNSTWVAGDNDKFIGASKKEVRALMGTVVDPNWTIKGHAKQTPEVVNDALPESFDARVQWPECEPVINHVRDQSNCGSCWAHGTTEALNDRKCIATGGDFQTLLSVSDTTGCCNGTKCFSFGCNGGQIGTPWNFFKKYGIVTGGDFGDNELCYDYTMAKCAHHVTSPDLGPCDDILTEQPVCAGYCFSNPTIVYEEDKNFAQTSYGFDGIDAIKQDIYTYGTVTSAFTVYEDFLTYKSGVYQHQTGDALGGHAIKTIGWGTEDGVDYWLCVNSWNNTWGDMGTFKIAMDQEGISDEVHAGLA